MDEPFANERKSNPEDSFGSNAGVNIYPINKNLSLDQSKFFPETFH